MPNPAAMSVSSRTLLRCLRAGWYTSPQMTSVSVPITIHHRRSPTSRRRRPEPLPAAGPEFTSVDPMDGVSCWSLSFSSSFGQFFSDSPGTGQALLVTALGHSRSLILMALGIHHDAIHQFYEGKKVREFSSRIVSAKAKLLLTQCTLLRAQDAAGLKHLLGFTT